MKELKRRPPAERKKEKFTMEIFLRKWLILPFLGIFFCAFLNLLLAFLGITAVEEGSGGIDVLSQFQTLPFFTVVITCIVAPFLEELLFRKLLFGKLSLALPWWAAMLISSAVFGVLHFNVPQGIYGFFFGLLLCETMRRTGSFLSGVIVHVAANLFSVLMNSVPAWNAYFTDHSVLLCIVSGAAFLLTFFLFELLTTEKQTLENPMRED